MQSSGTNTLYMFLTSATAKAPGPSRQLEAFYARARAVIALLQTPADAAPDETFCLAARAEMCDFRRFSQRKGKGTAGLRGGAAAQQITVERGWPTIAAGYTGTRTSGHSMPL